MPPRFLSLVIIAFWLAATGWLFQRDLWPRLRPGEPPPYVIDLADEASEQKIFWNILKGEQNMGYAQTWVRYQPDDDTFELSGLYKLFSGGREKQLEADLVIDSSYRVTREGELRQFTVEIAKPDLGVTGHLRGRIQDGLLMFHLKAYIPLSKTPLEWNPNPVKVSQRGNILNPCLPLNRVSGIRPGQSWRQPWMDPEEFVSDLLPLKSAEVRILYAQVSPEPQTLRWGSRTNLREDACHVIDYQGGDIQARVWVRQADGLVLRQEMRRGGDALTLQRD